MATDYRIESTMTRMTRPEYTITVSELKQLRMTRPEYPIIVSELKET